MNEYNPLAQQPQNGGIQRQVSFQEAIQMGFQKYASFAGRSSRSEYWWWALFAFIVGLCAGLIGGFLGDWFTYLVSLAMFIPGLSVCCRRLHDIGKAAGWIFIGLVPVVGAILLLIWMLKESEPMANRFGEEPNMIN